MSKTSGAIPLSLAAELLKAGRMKDLAQRQILIDLKSVTHDEYQSLLELLRYTQFGHRIIEKRRLLEPLQDADSRSRLQRVYDEIHMGRYQAAFEELKKLSLDESVDQGEVVLEKARIMAFRGAYEEVIQSLTPALKSGLIHHIDSKGNAFQHLGHAYLETGNFDRARTCLAQALDLAEMIGNASGEISARLFLSKCHSLLGDSRLAHDHLDRSAELCKGPNGNMRWLLGYYRTRSHVALFERSPSAILDATAALHLARAFNDRLHVARGLIERSLMNKIFYGKPLLRHEEELFLRDEARNSETNLPVWMEAHENERLERPGPITLRFFLGLLGLPRTVAELNLKTENPSWFYDSSQELLVDVENSQFLVLKKESPLAKMLQTLSSECQGVGIPRIFESVWRLPWDERHMDLIKVNLSRLRHLVPSVKVSRRNNLLSLEKPGWVY